MKYLLSTLLTACIGVCSAANNDPIRKIEAADGPKVLGAYSQALCVDLNRTKSLVFVAGQVAIDPKTGKMNEENIHTATNQTLDNIEAILKEAGTDWSHVVRMDVFLKNFDKDWDGMNEEYAKRFPNGVYPVRQTVGVQLDPDTLVEISCIAVVPKGTK